MSIDWNNVFLTWYGWLTSLNAALAGPIRTFSDGLGIPFLSAFLFGLLGTTAPCQLSTNFGALAFLARQPAERGATVRATAAYIAAKVLVYTLVGGLALMVGQQIFSSAGPYIDWVRRIIGPLMIVLGLAILGVIHVRLQFGQKLARRIEREAKSEAVASRPPASRSRTIRTRPTLIPTQARSVLVAVPAGAGQSTSGALAASRSEAPAIEVAPQLSAPSVRSAFMLGLGFSLAFCPTLVLLFFGATMTLAARSPGGITFPALFAIGTAIPLALFVGVALTSANAAQRMRRGMRRVNRPLRWIAGIVLILLGLHDTIVYWFI